MSDKRAEGYWWVKPVGGWYCDDWTTAHVVHLDGEQLTRVNGEDYEMVKEWGPYIGKDPSEMVSLALDTMTSSEGFPKVLAARLEVLGYRFK